MQGTSAADICALQYQLCSVHNAAALLSWLTSSRCSGVELSVSLVGNDGPDEDAADLCRAEEAPLGMLLELEAPEFRLLAFSWMTTLRTCQAKQQYWNNSSSIYIPQLLAKYAQVCVCV